VSEAGSPRAWRRLGLAFVDPQSYGLVILLIIASYLVSVNVTQTWTGSLVLFVQIATVWFALRTAKTHRHVRTVASILLVITAVAALAGIVKPDDSRPFLLALSCLLYLIAPFAIVRHIAERPGVDRETVLGAIAAYLLLGMFFGFLYRLLGEVQDGPFFGTSGVGTLPEVLFFSFTTLTTTGYGNLVPAENPGQTIAVMEMILGQLFLITAVGKIIAEWRPKKWRSADDTVADGGADQP
jgi:hypothetical protein